MSGPLPPFDWSYTDGKWRCVYLGQRLTVLPNGAWVVSGADGSVSSIGQQRALTSTKLNKGRKVLRS